MLNGYAVARTVEHINSHSEWNDRALRHFNPVSVRWRELRGLLGMEPQAPVLISGFFDTPTPHMIGHGLGPVPNFLGKTITSFWTGVDPARIVHEPPWFGWPHWMKPEQLKERLIADPIFDWTTTYHHLLSQARFAILPISGAYSKVAFLRQLLSSRRELRGRIRSLTKSRTSTVVEPVL